MSEPGFRASRTAIAKRVAPVIMDHDDERLRKMSTCLRDLGEDRQAYVEEITKLWRDAAERFLTIGRYLMRAKKLLRHGNFEAMITADLPFGKRTAQQLKAIAEAVDDGEIEERDLPLSWSTAYKLVEMKPDVFARAKAAQLVRPTVTRREIIVFQRRLFEEAKGRRPRPELLAEQREVLKIRLTRLQEEMREVKRQLAEIEDELKSKVFEGVAEPIHA
jgi:Protein of unknown function (DUF3102)